MEVLKFGRSFLLQVLFYLLYIKAPLYYSAESVALGAKSYQAGAALCAYLHKPPGKMLSFLCQRVKGGTLTSDP